MSRANSDIDLQEALRNVSNYRHYMREHGYDVSWLRRKIEELEFFDEDEIIELLRDDN